MVKRLLKGIFGRDASEPPIGSTAANDAIRAKLSEMDDDGSIRRHVRHFVYPGSGSDTALRIRVIEMLGEVGLEVSDENFHDGLVAEHHAVVADAAFDNLTIGLVTGLSQMGWIYDGWECAVVGDDS